MFDCRYNIQTEFETSEFYNASYYKIGGSDKTDIKIPGYENLTFSGKYLTPTANNVIEMNSGMARHYAYLFNMYVFLQIFNEINAKKLLPSENNPFEGLFNNFFFTGVMFISMIFQLGFVQIRPVAAFMKMRPLGW